jgi:hypothetical protein
MTTKPPVSAPPERAELGVDGNCGFALLGEDIQSGKAEFVEVKQRPDEHIDDARSRAATQALRKLEARLCRKLSYYIGPSHPRHM